MDNLPIVELDESQLKSALIGAIPQAFNAIKDAHSDEQLYAFALYSCPEALYIMPSFNTEEGLTRVAQRYLEKHGGSLEGQRRSLRWNPCDWAYHLEGKAFFEKATELMNESWSFLVDYEGLNADGHGQTQVFETCIEVLQALDKQGVFGQDAERLNLTVLLTMGDGNKDFLTWAKLLNPAPVYERLAAQLTSNH